MPLSPGTRLGPYEILASIGAGGMGEVYRARDTRLGRDVALKLLPAEFSLDPARLARFEHEARAAGSLNHPGIVAVYDVGVHEGLHYIVSELVDGRTLRAILAEGPLPPRKAADLAAQIADTIAAAHAAGIVHRDLKPENIMIARDGRAKVLDFGLAKHAATSSAQSSTVTALTDPGMVVGTVGYMSPEQVRGETAGHLSDVFSFGLVLHEMLSGQRAFHRATAAETMTAILREDPPELPSTISPALRNIVAHCLEKEASARFQSSKDLAFALRSSSSTTASSGPVPAVGHTARKRRWGLASLAALLGGLVLFYAAARWTEPDLIDQSRLRFRPFVADPGIETTPRWSPRGDTVAYAAEVNGVFQIFTRKIGSNASTQHTRHAFDCLAPFWSPDGTRLYYTGIDSAEHMAIWSVAVAGGEPQRVLEQAAFGSISSDGQALAFLRCSSSAACGVWLSSPPGAQPKRFPSQPFADRLGMLTRLWIEFAPARGPLGILDNTTSASEFYRASQDGLSCRREWSLPRLAAYADASNFSWLPDSRAILMAGSVTNDAGSLDLVRDGRLTPLRRGELRFSNAAVSLDGKAVCYTVTNANFDVYEIALAGPAMRPLLATGIDERSPAWSPDGRLIAYYTQAPSSAIEVYDRQSVTSRTLLSFGDSEAAMDLAFSPDGKRLAFRRQRPGEYTISITSLAGDTPVPLWNDPKAGPQRGPVWSPDGNFIAYYGLRDGKPAIFKARVGGSEAPEFVTAETAGRPLRWSPRGDWLACDTAAGLNLVSPDGKQVRKVSDRHWETFGFSNDGRNLVGIRVSDNLRLLLASIDVSTGQERVLGDLGPRPAAFTAARIRMEFPLRGFSLAPDGKSFLTSMVRESSDLWIMEGINQRRSLWQKLWPWPSTE